MSTAELIPLKERLAPYRERKGYIMEPAIDKILTEFLDIPILSLSDTTNDASVFFAKLSSLWQLCGTDPLNDDPTIREWMLTLETAMQKNAKTPKDKLSLYTDTAFFFYNYLKLQKHPVVAKLVNVNYEKFLHVTGSDPARDYYTRFAELYTEEYTVGGQKITCKDVQDISDRVFTTTIYMQTEPKTILRNIARIHMGPQTFYPFKASPSMYLSKGQIDWINSYLTFFKPLICYINKKGDRHDQCS